MLRDVTWTITMTWKRDCHSLMDAAVARMVKNVETFTTFGCHHRCVPIKYRKILNQKVEMDILKKITLGPTNRIQNLKKVG